MTKMPKRLKDQINRRAAKLFDSLGAVRKQRHGDGPAPDNLEDTQFILHTKYGPLLATPDGDWIYFKFVYPELAVGHGLLGLNPFSGKWNLCLLQVSVPGWEFPVKATSAKGAEILIRTHLAPVMDC